jgi:hypothetical protein
MDLKIIIFPVSVNDDVIIIAVSEPMLPEEQPCHR